jgi:lipid A 3-O-deacylase
VGAGAMLRIGQGLKSDWGPPRMAPAEQGADFTQASGFAWYLFAGSESRALARNLFLDGNSFEASRSVRRETLVSDFNAGLALLFRGLAFDLSYTQRSHEFAGQRGNDAILSGTVSFPY